MKCEPKCLANELCVSKGVSFLLPGRVFIWVLLSLFYRGGESGTLVGRSVIYKVSWPNVSFVSYCPSMFFYIVKGLWNGTDWKNNMSLIVLSEQIFWVVSVIMKGREEGRQS